MVIIMNLPLTFAAMTGALALLSLAAPPSTVEQPSTPPEEVRTRLGLDPFYTRYHEAMGVPIVSSDKVSPAALHEAAFLLRHMLTGREDLARAITDHKIRLAIMAPDEFTTDIPEHRHLTPPEYWNRRARGLGATHDAPAVSCGEENLLSLKGDPYFTENILIHEFAHVIHQMGLTTINPGFQEELEKTYQEAVARGLWQGFYAGTNAAEYWAEGVQSWFDCNRQNDASHNEINTRDELKSYDPALAALIARELGDRPWRYRRLTDRPAEEQSHVATKDPTTLSRTFSWPTQRPEGSDPQPN